MRRVLVIGSYNRDTVLRVPRFPRPGETIAAVGTDRFHGGKGSNQAVAAARAGAPVAILAAVGEDDAGKAARALWVAEGIGVDGVRSRSGVPTGEAVILLDAAGENQIVIVAGANATLEPEDAVAAVAGTGIVLAQLETPAAVTLAAFRAARTSGVTTMLNAAPAQVVPEALLAATDILVANETEAERLAEGAAAPPELAMALARRVSGGVVLTVGADGAWWADAGRAAIHVPAMATKVTDSTGAGDAFAGGMVAALAEGLGMARALQRGVVAGALACRYLGAVPSLPSRAEILSAGG